MAGQADPPRIDDVLGLVGLSDAAGRRVRGFTLGMRQRLGLATPLLTDPELLILDEPANGLDPEGVRWLRDLLRGLADDGATVLVSSHILAEVVQTVDSVVILDHGRLVTQSTLAELTKGARQVVRVRTPRAGELRVALAADGAQVHAVGSDRLEISGVAPECVVGCGKGSRGAEWRRWLAVVWLLWLTVTTPCRISPRTPSRPSRPPPER